MSANPTFDEVTACQKTLFEWAESYDTKDWDRLQRNLAPKLKVDYTSFLGQKWEFMPAEDFVKMASGPNFLGNPLLKTQHFIGLGKWQKLAADEIEGIFQVRVAHQKYTDSDLKEVKAKGHDHGTGTIWFKLIDGAWKFAGLEPNSRWAEFNMELIFGH